MLWVPIVGVAGLLYFLFRHRQMQMMTAPSTCPGLLDQERAELNRVLATDPHTLLAAARAQGLNKAMYVTAMHAIATQLENRGCKHDADRVHAKATAIGNIVEALPPAGPSTGVGVYTDPAMVAYTPGAYVDPAMAASMQAGAPTGAPAYAPIGPDVPLPSMPIALMRCGVDRCWVRPEARPWNDAMGRFGFSIPKNYPVGVLAFEPAGWAHVELMHPDHGRVDGYIEIAHLSPAALGDQVPTAVTTVPNVPGQAPVQVQTRLSPAQRTRARVAAKARATRANP